VRTTRLDLHLIRVHGMERGEELLAVVKGRPVITVETQEMAKHRVSMLSLTQLACHMDKGRPKTKQSCLRPEA
jgi:hypothetical protein